MATFNRPGVYIQETLSPVAPQAISNSASIGAFIGANDRGPTTPTLVSSWNQYTTLFGTWNTSAANDLPIAVYLFFANGGSSCYVTRITSSGALSATRSLNDRAGSPLATLSLSAANAGSWGNSLYVTISDNTLIGYFDLTVYYGGVSDSYVVERFTSMSMTATDARYAVTLINANSKYLIAADLGSTSTGTTKNPSVQAATQLASGSNGSNTATITNVVAASGTITYTAANSFSSGQTVTITGVTPSAYNLTNVTIASATSTYFTVVNAATGTFSSGGVATVAIPSVSAALSLHDVIKSSLILNLPGYTDAYNINLAISYASGRGDVFVVIDGLNDTVTNQLAAATSYTASSQAAVYYPRLTISDPTVGLGASSAVTKLVGPGGAIVGLYSLTDTSRGVWKAPAGLTTRLAGPVSIATLSNSDLDSLNTAAAPVNAIRYIPGSGIVVMGARTLKAGYADMYIPVRRTLIYLEKALKDLTEFALFEPNDQNLWRRIETSIDGLLMETWQQGGLRGGTPQAAYFIKCDADNNPQSAIDNGELHVEVGVSLQRPAEFIVIKISQYDGGTVVTVS
jgi:phage tail sheath protein FI